MKRTLWLGTALTMAAASFWLVPASAQNAKPAAAKPAAAKPKPVAKPEAKADPTAQAVLLGQFGDWGAYSASPGGKKVCFALAKPNSATTEPAGRKRDQSYAFVSTRPAEKVKNEVSVIVGYPQKASVDATASIGNVSYVMYTANDGAWVKNAAEEAQMVETMRKGANMTVKSISAHNTKSTDVYTLKGLSEALDKVAEECR